MLPEVHQVMDVKMQHKFICNEALIHCWQKFVKKYDLMHPLNLVLLIQAYRFSAAIYFWHGK